MNNKLLFEKEVLNFLVIAVIVLSAICLILSFFLNNTSEVKRDTQEENIILRDELFKRVEWLPISELPKGVELKENFSGCWKLVFDRMYLTEVEEECS